MCLFALIRSEVWVDQTGKEIEMGSERLPDLHSIIVLFMCCLGNYDNRAVDIQTLILQSYEYYFSSEMPKTNKLCTHSNKMKYSI